MIAKAFEKKKAYPNYIALPEMNKKALNDIFGISSVYIHKMLTIPEALMSEVKCTFYLREFYLDPEIHKEITFEINFFTLEIG